MGLDRREFQRASGVRFRIPALAPQNHPGRPDQDHRGKLHTRKTRKHGPSAARFSEGVPVWVVECRHANMRATSARSNLHLFPEPALDRLFEIHQTDAFEWLRSRAQNSIHAVVTDPPYGLLEYTDEQKQKLRVGRGGVWRIPPSFDGCVRRPLPRFTILKEQHKAELEAFFSRLAVLLAPVLVPGAHVFIATNPLVSYLVYGPFIRAGFEKRGEIIRVVRTLRGGDRPKNAHHEFSDVSVMPRSCWEPWGLFRKPCEGRVQDNLRKWRTGGAPGGAPASSPSFVEAPTFSAATCPHRAAVRRGHNLGSLHGVRLHDCRLGRAGIEEHRVGDRPGILRHGAQCHSQACGFLHPPAGSEWPASLTSTRLCRCLPD